MKESKKYLARAAAAAYMGLIFWLSSKPSVPVPPLFENQDKVFHLLEYLALGILLSAGLPEGTGKRRYWIAAALASVYGATDELHQSFVPGRDATAGDWLADTVGGGLGAWLFLAWQRWSPLKKSKGKSEKIG